MDAEYETEWHRWFTKVIEFKDGTAMAFRFCEDKSTGQVWLSEMRHVEPK